MPSLSEQLLMKMTGGFRRGTTRCSWVGLLILLSLAAPASARIERKSMTLFSNRGAIGIFDLFGFKAGGTAEFEVSFKATGPQRAQQMQAFVVGCKEKILGRFEAKLEDTCLTEIAYSNSTFYSECFVLKVKAPETKETLIITRKEILQWAVITCGDGVADLGLYYSFMNPGGEHLDTGNEPNPRMFLVLMLIWLFLGTAQGGHACAWHSRHITTLHRIMFTVPAVKALYCGISMFKWVYMSQHGYFPDWVTLLQILASTLNQAATFGTLLLVARGWLITRRHLPPGELQSTVTSVVLLVVLSFTYRYYTLSNFSFFALAILYMTILALILSSVARNIRELKMQIMILRQADIDPTSTPAHTKGNMYRTFQFIMFAFVCTKIFLEMVLLFLRDYPWVSKLFTEAVDMILCFAVGYTFRLRTPNPFNTNQGDFSWLPFNPAELSAGDANTQTLLARMAELGVQITLPLPNIYETEIHKATRPGPRSSGLFKYDNEGCVEIPLGGQMMVVVEHPPTMEEEGVITENVALAARIVVDAGTSTGVSVCEGAYGSEPGSGSTSSLHAAAREEGEREAVMIVTGDGAGGQLSRSQQGSFQVLPDLPGLNHREGEDDFAGREVQPGDQNV